MGLFAETRQQQILEKIRLNGRMLVNELAGQLQVTEVTIRRDLVCLQKNGLIKKTYGGAVLTAPPEMNISVRYRQTRNLAAKRVVGKLAASLIKDNDLIYLEAGSTCYEIIPYLAQKKNITIICNSLYLMSRLNEMSQHQILLIGGQYRPQRMDMVGPNAEAAIAQLSGFKAFTGADDITIDSGISGSDVVTVSFAKLVLQRAHEVIFVGDHTKFDNPALYKIADIDELDYIVTDEAPSEQWLSAATQKNIKLVYPS